jgi:SAM-dependent methyltransferase
MSETISGSGSGSVAREIFSARPLRSLRLSSDSFESDAFAIETNRPPRWRTEAGSLISGLKRRWARERRRRKVGRAYDMALEIAGVIPRGAELLDVGCGSGFIAHHLSAMLGAGVIGIDLGSTTDAPIDYRRYDGQRFPVTNDSFDAVTLCYVLHHAQDVKLMLSELRRVLRDGGLAVIYEDIPRSWWDKGVCWIHNRQWRGRTGPCTFRLASGWRALFESCGFEIVSERPLSRWRNFTHPVARNLYVLRVQGAGGSIWNSVINEVTACPTFQSRSASVAHGLSLPGSLFL